MAKRRMKAGIYARISRDFTGERLGVERQIQECELLAKIYDFDIVGDPYVDNSISAHGTVGKKAKDRPDYDRMIKDFKKGKIDVIVAWKLDRLSRSALGFELMLNELAEQGLTVCTTEMGCMDLSRSDCLTIARMLVNFAELESSRKSERSKLANKQRAERGIMRKGTRLFGYDIEGNVIEHEAEVIRAIYDAYSKGSSIGAIARAISGHDDGTLPDMPTSEAPSKIALLEKEERDIAEGKDPLTRDEKYLKYRERTLNTEFGRSTVASILRNPRYAGFMYRAEVIKGKTQTYGSKWSDFIVRDPETGEYVKGNWEPIVDVDLWWLVQRKRDKNLTRADGTHVERTGWPKKHIGAGLYKCMCGRKLVTGGSGSTRKQKFYNYRCTETGEGHTYRMGEKVDAFVVTRVIEYLSQPNLKKLLLKPNENAPRLKEIKTELQEVDNLINQTRKMIVDKRDSFDEDFVEMMYERVESLKEDRAKLEAEQEELSPSLTLDILNAPNPAEEFAKLTDINQISEVIDYLCEVTLLKHPRGVRNTIENLEKDVIIKWKHH